MAGLMETSWRVPWLWRLLLFIAPAVVYPVCRLRVTGSVPEHLRNGPLILAANHISPFDPIVMTAACRKARLAPRFLATGGVFRAPVAGAVMRRCGHIRVDRRTAQVAEALPHAAAALKVNSTVLIYPEGRIGLDPWMWPERGKTGVARLAALSGAPVVPVAQWGTHAVLPYTTPRHLARSLLNAMLHRPVVHVRFGDPVDLSHLTGSAGAQAMRATRRIIEAIDATLVPLRADQPELPHHIDHTRPVDMSRVRPRPDPAP
ncbi:MAG TPA: lysophospholipid acyltransferase family protein [Longimicrobiaceae bacterium]